MMVQDHGRLYGALYALRILARKYEFKDEEDRAPLTGIVNGTFPALLQLFQVPPATESSLLYSPQNALQSALSYESPLPPCWLMLTPVASPRAGHSDTDDPPKQPSPGNVHRRGPSVRCSRWDICTGMLVESLLEAAQRSGMRWP